MSNAKSEMSISYYLGVTKNEGWILNEPYINMYEIHALITNKLKNPVSVSSINTKTVFDQKIKMLKFLQHDIISILR